MLIISTSVEIIQVSFHRCLYYDSLKDDTPA